MGNLVFLDAQKRKKKNGRWLKHVYEWFSIDGEQKKEEIHIENIKQFVSTGHRMRWNAYHCHHHPAWSKKFSGKFESNIKVIIETNGRREERASTIKAFKWRKKSREMRHKRERKKVRKTRCEKLVILSISQYLICNHCCCYCFCCMLTSLFRRLPIEILKLYR